MKKLILLMGITVISFTHFAMAQEVAPAQQSQPAQIGKSTAVKPNMGTPEDRAKRQTTMMTQQLNLTADAQTKIYNINLKYAQKREDLKKSGKTREEMQPEMQQMMKDQDADYKATLTADQYKTYTEKRGQMHPMMNAPKQ